MYTSSFSLKYFLARGLINDFVMIASAMCPMSPCYDKANIKNKHMSRYYFNYKTNSKRPYNLSLLGSRYKGRHATLLGGEASRNAVISRKYIILPS